MGGQDERTISSRAHVGISLTSVAGLVVGFGIFLYAQIEALRSDTLRRFEEFQTDCAFKWEAAERRFDTLDHDKADKNAASDRYTGKQAAERNRAVDQRFESIEKANSFAHESLRREIDHNRTMIRECKK